MICSPEEEAPQRHALRFYIIKYSLGISTLHKKGKRGIKGNVDSIKKSQEIVAFLGCSHKNKNKKKLMNLSRYIIERGGERSEGRRAPESSKSIVKKKGISGEDET